MCCWWAHACGSLVGCTDWVPHGPQIDSFYLCLFPEERLSRHNKILQEGWRVKWQAFSSMPLQRWTTKVQLWCLFCPSLHPADLHIFCSTAWSQKDFLPVYLTGLRLMTSWHWPSRQICSSILSSANIFGNQHLPSSTHFASLVGIRTGGRIWINMMAVASEIHSSMC